MTEMFFNPDHKGWLVKEGVFVCVCVCVCVCAHDSRAISVTVFRREAQDVEEEMVHPQ